MKIGCIVKSGSSSYQDKADFPIDEIGLWDRELTQAEVTTLQTNEISSLSNLSGLKAWYNFEQDPSGDLTNQATTITQTKTMPPEPHTVQ